MKMKKCIGILLFLVMSFDNLCANEYSLSWERVQKIRSIVRKSTDDVTDLLFPEKIDEIEKKISESMILVPEMDAIAMPKEEQEKLRAQIVSGLPVSAVRTRAEEEAEIQYPMPKILGYYDFRNKTRQLTFIGKKFVAFTASGKAERFQYTDMTGDELVQFSKPAILEAREEYVKKAVRDLDKEIKRIFKEKLEKFQETVTDENESFGYIYDEISGKWCSAKECLKNLCEEETKHLSSGTIFQRAKSLYSQNDNTDDLKRAVFLFEKAAADGHAGSAHYLGLCCLEGKGTEENPQKAVEYFKTAAADDYAEAEYMLGYCCLKGIGTAADPEKAEIHLEKAAKKHVRDSKNIYTQAGITEPVPEDSKTFLLKRDCIFGLGALGLLLLYWLFRRKK